MEKQNALRIGIIGGGAAGLIACGTAAKTAKEMNLDAEITLLEKNEKVGKKIYITGKGRCNVTNDLPPKDFLENVVNNPKFLSSALFGFSPIDTVNLLNENGTETKTERGRRVFPLSDKASDITKALIKYAEKFGAKIICNAAAEKIIKTESDFRVMTKDIEYHFDKVVLCTGGKSYPLTGSDGAGYNFAKTLGHTIVPLKPALVPIRLSENVSPLMGLSLKNVNLVFDNAQCGGKGKTELFGEMLFTSDGITGPIVLSMSSLLNGKNYKGKKISIDLKPALNFEVLDYRILSDFKKYSNKQIKNALFDLLPRSLVPFILNHVKLDGEKSVNAVTKEERKTLLNALKELTFSIDSLYDIETGIVTAGGVSVQEVNPKSMESKLVPGLFFAGEVLDVDAFTGGFNLQIAFSTGYLAGKYSVSQ